MKVSGLFEVVSYLFPALYQCLWIELSTIDLANSPGCNPPSVENQCNSSSLLLAGENKKCFGAKSEGQSRFSAIIDHFLPYFLNFKEEEGVPLVIFPRLSRTSEHDHIFLFRDVREWMCASMHFSILPINAMGNHRSDTSVVMVEKYT